MWTDKFEHESDSGRVYTISRWDGTDEWGCSCRGWTTHGHCRHLDQHGLASARYASFGQRRVAPRPVKIQWHRNPRCTDWQDSTKVLSRALAEAENARLGWEKYRVVTR